MAKLGIDVLSESEKKRIHQSAVTLLGKLGFLCNHPQLLEAFQRAGCKIGKEATKEVMPTQVA